MIEAVKKLSDREVRIPFILVTTSFFLDTFSGSSAIIYYSVEIFGSEDEGVVGLNKYLASIIVAAIIVIGGILGMFLVKIQPRVRLSMIMMTVKSVCMGVLATAISMSPSDYQLNMIKVTTVTVYMLCSSAGQSVSQSFLKSKFQFQEPLPSSLSSWENCCLKTTERWPE